MRKYQLTLTSIPICRSIKRKHDAQIKRLTNNSKFPHYYCGQSNAPRTTTRQIRTHIGQAVHICARRRFLITGKHPGIGSEH